MAIRFTGSDGPQELIPAPLVSISRNTVRDSGGKKLHIEYLFSLNGTIVNTGSAADSPDATGDGMNGILLEQKRIRQLFAVDGGRLEIEAPNGGGAGTIDAYCTVENVNFQEGVWVDRCNYTISLKAIDLTNETPEDDNLVNNPEESWSITENEDGTFNFSHQLNAVGIRTYGDNAKDPIELARSWCQKRSYFINTDGELSKYEGDIFDFSTLLTRASAETETSGFWNMAKTEGLGIVAGSWQLSESFVYSLDGNAKEDYSIAISYDANDSRKVVFSINGSVIGFADKNSNKELKLTNATNMFNSSVEPNIYTRLMQYVPEGTTLNPTPTTKQISYEIGVGAIRYTYVYTTITGSLITGSIDENISIVDAGKTDIFAQIPVPGRTNGPVVQNMFTTTLPERTVSISATLSGEINGSILALYGQKPNTDTLIDALKPSAGYYYIKQNTEEWNPIKRQYARTVSWVIQHEGVTINGIPNMIHNTSNL